jgi:hypothetical protein
MSIQLLPVTVEKHKYCFHNKQAGGLMIVEIKVDGSIWVELDVKDAAAPQVIKILENASQQIRATQNNNAVLRVHQLRKKYG